MLRGCTRLVENIRQLENNPLQPSTCLFHQLHDQALAPICHNFLDHLVDRFPHQQFFPGGGCNHRIGSFFQKLDEVSVNDDFLIVKPRYLNHSIPSIMSWRTHLLWPRPAHSTLHTDVFKGSPGVCKKAGGPHLQAARPLRLPLQTDYLIQELIGHGNNTRAGLEASLRSNHVREFLSKVNIGFLQRA